VRAAFNAIISERNLIGTRSPNETIVADVYRYVLHAAIWIVAAYQAEFRN